MMLYNDRKNGNEAIDTFILGMEKRDWTHRYISNDACPVCDVERHIISSPALPPSIDENLDRIVRAKNEHEVGHAKFTPAVNMRGWSGAKRNLTNALEDLRIEKALSSLKCGGDVIKGDLKYSNDEIIGKLNQRMAYGEVKMGVIDEAIMAMHIGENGHAPMWSVTPMAKMLIDIALPIFKKWKTATLDKGGFATVERIADEILAKWNDACKSNGQDGNSKKQDKRKNSSQKQDGQGESNGQDGEEQDGDGESTSNGQGNSSNGKSGKSSKKQEKQDGEEQENSNSEEQGNSAEEQENSSNGEKNGQESEKQDGKGDDGDADENADNGTENGQDGQNGDDDADNSNSSNGQDMSNADNHEPSKVEKSGDTAPTQSTASENRSFEDLEKECGNSALDEILKEQIKNGIADAKESFGNYTAFTDNDEIIRANEDKSAYEHAYNEIRGMVATLTSHLEQSLRSMSRCRILHGRDKGNLDMSRMVAISKSLDKNIFYTKTNGISLDVSVSILVDESGSIGSMCYDFRRVAIAFCEALERLGIKFEVLGHTTGGGRNGDASQFIRIAPMRIYEHKRFDEPYRAERYRLGSLDAYGCNIDGEALLHTVKRNIRQRTARHIVLVLSDGQPNQNHRSQALYDHLTSVVDYSRKVLGVEIYAFGIRTNEPKQFYGDDNFLYIEDTNKMDGQFMRSFANIITKGNLKG